MKGIKRLIKAMILTIILSTMSLTVFAEEFVDMPSKTEVSIIKPWTVNCSLDLDSSSVNSTNIIVKDSSGNVVKANVLPGDNSKSIIVCPPTGGYTPNKNYTLTLSTNVKSSLGKKLTKAVRMSFTTSIKYEDCTSYSSLPVLKDIKFNNSPIMMNQKIDFNVYGSYSGQVQYRIFDFRYPNDTYDNANKYPNNTYNELTTGYTSAKDGNTVYPVSLTSGLESGKHKIVVYVKRANKQGKYKDGNTDYDNYYSTYFKVLDSNIIKDKKSNETVIYKEYSKSLDDATKEQVDGAPIYSDNGWNTPSTNLIKYYMNGNNFLDNYDKYMFLSLNYMEVSVEDLNNMLKGKGILVGTGAAFLQAAKDSNINPIYLVSHALLETGNGTSALAKGILVSSVDGKPVTPKVVYNMFGVHAFDSNPNKYGSEYAYSQGWFSVDAAIKGGAKFISSGYINSTKYMQNNLYKMKWNISVTWHQYATDIGWARKQIANIKTLIESCKSAKPVYEIPKFK
ncbi:glucosaminidase domain-containing protein [Clostridium brassicae]|uniref:Glucosaminidase domain-containing protein n=1 Tax=Clostridium brassicae TaxID=2999072 RepID=A0ABT4DD01_9CLOT|nr:glucosaminidase domain-containing protein [Clostridium brassicae]MCY6960190.1 glucosaminidase domain-containing protein [Clostridium brassicae]